MGGILIVVLLSYCLGFLFPLALGSKSKLNPLVILCVPVAFLFAILTFLTVVEPVLLLFLVHPFAQPALLVVGVISGIGVGGLVWSGSDRSAWRNFIRFAFAGIIPALLVITIAPAELETHNRTSEFRKRYQEYEAREYLGSLNSHKVRFSGADHARIILLQTLDGSQDTREFYSGKPGMADFLEVAPAEIPLESISISSTSPHIECYSEAGLQAAKFITKNCDSKLTGFSVDFSTVPIDQSSNSCSPEEGYPSDSLTPESLIQHCFDPNRVVEYFVWQSQSERWLDHAGNPVDIYCSKHEKTSKAVCSAVYQFREGIWVYIWFAMFKRNMTPEQVPQALFETIEYTENVWSAIQSD